MLTIFRGLDRIPLPPCPYPPGFCMYRYSLWVLINWQHVQRCPRSSSSSLLAIQRSKLAQDDRDTNEGVSSRAVDRPSPLTFLRPSQRPALPKPWVLKKSYRSNWGGAFWCRRYRLQWLGCQLALRRLCVCKDCTCSLENVPRTKYPTLPQVPVSR